MEQRAGAGAGVGVGPGAEGGGKDDEGGAEKHPLVSEAEGERLRRMALRKSAVSIFPSNLQETLRRTAYFSGSDGQETGCGKHSK